MSETGYTCRICRHRGPGASYRVREMMLGLGELFSYFQCELCGCLQITELPADMTRYYPAEYYSFSGTSRDKDRSALVRWARKTRNYYSVCAASPWGRIFTTLFPNKKLTPLSVLSLNRHSRILDVGCGSGWRLFALREAGFMNTQGIDPFIAQDIEYENGLRIEKRTIHEMTGQWDLIMFHHSFEHVPDQLETFQAAARMLHPEGTCLIRVPTVSSYAWEHYREHWVQLDAPRHYYLHSVKSLSLLAAQAGFALQRFLCDSTVDQFRGSEAYKRGITLFQKTDFSRGQLRTWKRQTAVLNRQKRGDQAVYYFKLTGKAP